MNRLCDFPRSFDRNLFIMRILIPMLLLPVLAFAAGQSGTNATSTINVMPLPASVQMRTGRAEAGQLVRGRYQRLFRRATNGSDLRLQQRLEGRTGIVLPLGVAASGKPAVL